MQNLPSNWLKILPGLGFFALVSLCIVLLNEGISASFIDPLVIALFFGILFRNLFPKIRWHRAGTQFSAKYVLEFSIAILGASIAFQEVLKSTPQLFALIFIGVTASMLLAYFVGHVVLKLSSNLAILIGASNSICGNSAAVVIAPIIRASSAELTSAIAISGILGAAQIVILPLLAPALGLSDYHYGVVAGMAVYAVAQVYAASAVVSSTSASVATFVKLTRVLLLVPLVVIIELILSKKNMAAQKQQLEMELDEGGVKATFKSMTLQRYIPWFVFGFLLLGTLRSVGIIDENLGSQIRDVSRYTFLVAMIAIGTSVNIRDIIHVGLRVATTIAVVLSFMVAISVIWGSYL